MRGIQYKLVWLLTRFDLNVNSRRAFVLLEVNSMRALVLLQSSSAACLPCSG